MLALKKLSLFCGAAFLVLQLGGCASAIFPDIDEEEDDIVVGEGGRIVRESNSLKADEKNASYEGEDDEETAADVAQSEETAQSADDEESSKDVGDLLSESDEAEKAAETIPVMSEDLKSDKPAQSTAQTIENLTDASAGPSISYRLDTILFANGSAAVDPSYNATIKRAVKAAKASDARIIVYGYASSRTRNTDPVSHKMANFKVSLERAQNVAAALRRAGMPADRISIEALSDSAPLYQEVMPEGERLNRRAEIYISY